MFDQSKIRNTEIQWLVFYNYICFINDFNTVSYNSYMNGTVQCEISSISMYIMYVLMYNDETMIKNKVIMLLIVVLRYDFAVMALTDHRT